MSELSKTIEESLELASLVQPNQLCPCMDLRSRLLFDNKYIKDIVVTTVIACNRFLLTSPIQWSNKSISEIVSLSQIDDLPPIIIEFQHTVNVDYYLDLISSGILAARQYKTPPILITFAMSSMKYEARYFYFVTIDSIQQNLTEEPLDKFVALSIFLISQHHSLATKPYNLDPTIQKLYTISKQIFKNQTAKRKSEVIDDLMYVCDETNKKLKEAIVVLEQSEVPETVKNILNNCIEEVILINNTFKTKYDESDCPSTPSSPDVETSLLSGDVASLPNSPSIKEPAQTERSRSENWEYINNQLSSLGETKSVPWEVIFVNGKRDGYFSTFRKSTSLRASYSRWKNGLPK